jgi:hypothetical protein
MEIIEMNIRLILPIIFALASCVGGSDFSANRVGGPIDIRYSVMDIPSEKKLYVSFRNDTNTPVCLGPENWPSNGILLNDGKTVSLMADGKSMFLKAEQDYCPKCSIRVGIGSESVAYFRYESFNIPENLIISKKALSFHPLGYRCR